MIENYYPTLMPNTAQQLGGNASAIVSSGAGTAATLYAVAAGAQALPVVGQILGAVALVAGFLAASYAKSKAIKNQAQEVDKANADLIIQNAELDNMVANSEQTITAINTELTKAGLNGLNGFSNFLKKTFTPVKYQQGILEDKQAINTRLTKEAEQKISLLEGYKKQLESLYDKLTGGKNLQRTLLIGGGIAFGLASFYFLNLKYKWIKF